MSKNFRSFIAGFISCAILTCGVSFAYSQFKSIDVVENNVTIYANGNKVDSPNFTYNDSTYVPLRAVLEKMDCSISYDEETKTVNAVNNYNCYVEANSETDKAETKSEPDKSDAIKIKITLTNNKSIEANLYPHVAPETVNNFVKLVNEKFYNGLVFHRVIEGFMIQGGGCDKSIYDGTYKEKETDSIFGEFKNNGFDNNLKHTRGVLSMARSTEPNSASSQFFIMHQDYPYLDGEYAAFGEVTKGMDVVDSIATSKTTTKTVEVGYWGTKFFQEFTDVPETPVVIKTIEIIK